MQDASSTLRQRKPVVAEEKLADNSEDSEDDDSEEEEEEVEKKPLPEATENPVQAAENKRKKIATRAFTALVMMSR
jgi:hypothetical protein